MGTEKCPFCGQEIDAGAGRCFFCGSKLDEESVEERLEQLQKQQKTESARKIRYPLVVEVLLIVILICTTLYYAPSIRRRSTRGEGLSESSTVRLKAKVTFTGSRFIISNNDSFDWENVKLEIVSGTIGNGFSLNVPKISAGEAYTVGAKEFVKKDGTNFNPYVMKPQSFWIRCGTSGKENGSYLAGWK